MAPSPPFFENVGLLLSLGIIFTIDSARKTSCSNQGLDQCG